MPDKSTPEIYSIAAHRGFADALVAGLVPRYREDGFDLARLTLLLPSSRAVRTVTEAFVRHYGAQGPSGAGGMLMPRMAVIGDLDLDETLGSLLDPLGDPSVAGRIPPAIDPTERWLRIADIIPGVLKQLGREIPGGAGVLRLATQAVQAMDRLLVEDIAPTALWEAPVLDAMDKQSSHWIENTKLFYAVQQVWGADLERLGKLDAATRRNRLFDHAAQGWKATPPATPIVAAGVTSAAPALARLLRVVADLPQGAVILPDLDLTMPAAVWDELGTAGAPENAGDPPFERGDCVTHPQYHLKLLLNRMGVARAELRQWHRKGDAAAPPERSHAISSLFLPPEASRSWIDLAPEKRRLAGVRLMESTGPEEEAQAVALLVRQAIAEPEKRVAVVTPDRGLARRVVQHLRRWNIVADDSAGQPLPQTPAGRLLLLLAECAAENAAPVPLVALLEHPLVWFENDRGKWLKNARAFELELRGPRQAPGLSVLDSVAVAAQVGEWWSEVSAMLEPLIGGAEERLLADWLDALAAAGEALCADALWSREDGRALASFVENLRLHAREIGTILERRELHAALRDAMEPQAVRPSYGGHPRVAIYGLLESRMSRAELVICAGLNEGSWPATPATDPLLAPAILRALGVPGADFRIGLSAHDLAGALGAPEVVLSRSQRDISGPAIPSRFWLRVRALLGDDLLERHGETEAILLARALDVGEPAPRYKRPEPRPSAAQRRVHISVSALDRLRSDPYQFYASSVLRLSELPALDEEPGPAERGTMAHTILEKWHKAHAAGKPLAMDEAAAQVLQEINPHPLMRALWQPRLMLALQWVEQAIDEQAEGQDGRTPVMFEEWADMKVQGVEIFGKVDRIDRDAEGNLAIVDYKTGGPPSGAEVEAGYALQLGTLGLMAQAGRFGGLSGKPTEFEYWSLAKSDKSETGFGYVATPVLKGNKRSGIPPEEFLPKAQAYLDDALAKWILGDEPFTARLNPDAQVYSTFDQLMRLDEWLGREESGREESGREA